MVNQMNDSAAFFTEARRSFHAALLKRVLKINRGIPTNSDACSKVSVSVALGIIDRLRSQAKGARLAGQMSGPKFEIICAEFLKETFFKLKHLRPGHWEVNRGLGSGRLANLKCDQYEHLAALDLAAKANPALAVALGSDYLIKPDVIIIRYPEEDHVINAGSSIVDEHSARLTSIRKLNNQRPILHASISCKWTLRSDRAQNARSEALNLVRNRKGRLPHVVVVTGEPAPTRIASIALGTGDIDCVYHFALPELAETVKKLKYEDSIELVNTMVQGKRLRDIGDLPLDLVI